MILVSRTNTVLKRVYRKKLTFPFLKSVLYHVSVYTVGVSNHQLYMNQVPENFYYVYHVITLKFILPLY